MRAAAYSTHALSLPSYACDRTQSPRLVRPLVGAPSIIQLGMAVVVCIRLCQNPRSTSILHASMPLESKPVYLGLTLQETEIDDLWSSSDVRSRGSQPSAQA